MRQYLFFSCFLFVVGLTSLSAQSYHPDQMVLTSTPISGLGGQQLTVQLLERWTDAEQLHRRDYNLFPQAFPDGREGYTAFSGVFRYDANLPFLNSVDIDADGYTVNYDFLQYYA